MKLADVFIFSGAKLVDFTLLISFAKMYDTKLHCHINIQSQLFRSRTRIRIIHLKNSKSSKRLLVVLNSLGFKRLSDLDKQFMYHDTSRNSTVLLTKVFLL